PMIDSISLNPRQNLTPASSCLLSFRIDNCHAHPSRRYAYTDAHGATHTRKDPPWAVLLSDTDGCRCWITISKTEINDDIISSSSGTVVTISIASPTSTKTVRPMADALLPTGKNGSNSGNPAFSETILAQQTFKDQALPFAGETLWNIELSDRRLHIVAGATQPIEIANIPIGLSILSSFGFAASPGGEILISDISYQPNSAFSPIYSSILHPTSPNNSDSLNASVQVTEQIHRIIDNSDDPIEGYWEIFDRTLDEALLKLGGEYKLAIVKNHDRYDIIYLDGARVNGSRWQSGMLKGLLTPSSFPGLLNLEWFDSEGKSLSYSITAQTGYNGTLTLQFPYHSSVIRLWKAQ
ncbi:MAG: hypothetical protein K2J78_01375, partial [Muribaculaceae bacterium]|nr:hypothetical protein [Muribaculaceae bacterium]